MARCAAFLRGINVSGRKATGDQLRAAFAAAGLDGATTFRASGNVIFDAGARAKPEALAARIEKHVHEALGYEIAAFVRTAAEVRAIARHVPFPVAVVEASSGKLQVVLLAAPPSAPVRKRMLALETDDDRLAFRGRELYWLPSGGLMSSGIGMSGVSEVLGSNTVRTKGTIEQLAAKFFA